MSLDPLSDPVSPAQQTPVDLPGDNSPEGSVVEDHPSLSSPGQDETRTGKIERVIDVPLAVTLRFGQRHLTLREVLTLATGSLVELDRQVEEPVDLVLGDRLIARGEVVIVDGNYGLRVTEVVEGAAHRIQRLHANAAPESPLTESPAP